MGTGGNARESGVSRAVDYDGRGCAERRLAKLAHERAAHADHLDGRQSLVDDAHIGIRLFWVLQCMGKHDVLLRDQSDSDAVTDGGVEEIADLFRGHVLCAFLKPTKIKESDVGRGNKKVYYFVFYRDRDRQHSHSHDLLVLCVKENSPFGHG